MSGRMRRRQIHKYLLSGGYKADCRFSGNDTGFQLIHTWVCTIVDLVQQDFHRFFPDLIQRLSQGSELRADFLGQQGRALQR